jgi:hypothetical protein
MILAAHIYHSGNTKKIAKTTFQVSQYSKSEINLRYKEH